MYELFAFVETLNPVVQGILSGLVAFLAIFLFRGFCFWFTGANLILEELKTLNINLKEIKETQYKIFDTERRIWLIDEISDNKLTEIQRNTEQLVNIWEE